MNPAFKRWIADWVPEHVRRLARGTTRDGAVRYSGNFSTWDEARRHSLGYDAPAILERVKQAVQTVQRGEAAQERDSVVFDRVQHSYPLLFGLLRSAVRNGGCLNVVDVGGSLGSTFFQCRPLLAPETSVSASPISWSIVEQPLFATCGRQHFENAELHFYDDLQTCLAKERPNVALLSSVLPYVETPHDLLDTVSQAVSSVIIDRTPLWSALPDRLTVQSVPASIYGFPSSYPAWILNRERLLAHFEGRFRIVCEFDALAGAIDVDGDRAHDRGFLLERTSAAS